jgi:hypothetical protein
VEQQRKVPEDVGQIKPVLRNKIISKPIADAPNDGSTPQPAVIQTRARKGASRAVSFMALRNFN